MRLVEVLGPIALLGVVGIACRVVRTTPPAEPAVSAPAVRESRVQPSLSSEEMKAAFVDQVRRDCRGEIIFYPLVSTSGRGEARTSELGLELAEDLARMASRLGADDLVARGPNSAAALHADLNRACEVPADAPGLEPLLHSAGVTYVVIGRLEEERGPGLHRSLHARLEVHPVSGEQACGSGSIVFVSDRPDDASAFRGFAKDVGGWSLGSPGLPPPPVGSLDAELDVACRLLAAELSTTEEWPGGTGTVYVPPAESANLVAEVARLRSAQRAYSAEYGRRLDTSVSTGTQLVTDSPLTLDGQEFSNLQAAEAHVDLLRESLMATSGATLCQTVSAQLAQELRPLLDPRPVILDLGFTKWSDTQLTEGELATGGLAKSLRVRRLLEESGVEVVTALRFEEVGDTCALRAEVYDLQAIDVAASAKIDLHRSLFDELENAFTRR